jgi:hypothetical protein
MTTAAENEGLLQMIVDNAVAVTGLETGAIYLGSEGGTLVTECDQRRHCLPNFPNANRIITPEDHPHIARALVTGEHDHHCGHFQELNLTAAEKEVVQPQETEIDSPAVDPPEGGQRRCADTWVGRQTIHFR